MMDEQKRNKRQEEFSSEFGHYAPASEKEQLAKGLKKLFEPNKKEQNKKKSKKTSEHENEDT
ncbi:hypothetical protein [Shouchella patagoniensis]|uniref:hypothetical protein n=1 Tax=Shouchella patagoniensis TaxID=228576 RepID=UPI0009958162|nr:hypothetical protein [Shouchella patagoniensis]